MLGKEATQNSVTTIGLILNASSCIIIPIRPLFLLIYIWSTSTNIELELRSLMYIWRTYKTRNRKTKRQTHRGVYSRHVGDLQVLICNSASLPFHIWILGPSEVCAFLWDKFTFLIWILGLSEVCTVFEFYIAKLSPSSTLIVYLCNVYQHMNLYILTNKCEWVCLVSYIDVVFVDGRGPFRYLERKFWIFSRKQYFQYLYPFFVDCRWNGVKTCWLL